MAIDRTKPNESKLENQIRADIDLAARALEQKDHDELYRIIGRMEERTTQLINCVDVITALWHDKRDPDTAPLERVAMAAVQLAEKVIDDHRRVNVDLDLYRDRTTGTGAVI